MSRTEQSKGSPASDPLADLSSTSISADGRGNPGPEAALGFEIVNQGHLPAIGAFGKHLKHSATGAEILSLETSDEEKTFQITFRTPPRNAAGESHCLEHLIGFGSDAYPLNKIYHAIWRGYHTSSIRLDTTCEATNFGFSTVHPKEYQNLREICVDLAFHPTFSEEAFSQEVWRYEREQQSGRLAIRGITYSEMKSNYASTDFHFQRKLAQGLFPEVPYLLDYGGNPKHMVELSLDRLKDYHRRFYHPSNARFCLYGNDDPIERLHFLADFLASFEKRSIDGLIPLQSRWNEPRQMRETYCPESDFETSRGARVGVGWLLPKIRDYETLVGLHVVSNILWHSSASPLVSALYEIEGEDGCQLLEQGLEDEIRQPYFSIGIAGLHPENVPKVEKTILRELSRILDERLDPLLIQAGLRLTEFQFRGITLEGMRRGEFFADRANSTWLYDRNPLEPLRFDAHLDAIERRIAGGERYFEGLIDRYLVKNKHRLMLAMVPDAESPRIRAWGENGDRTFLRSVEKTFSEEQLVEIDAVNARMRSFQGQKDSDEELAKLPHLGLEDLRIEELAPAAEITNYRGAKIVYHDLSTDDLAQIAVAINLDGLPEASLQLIDVFGSLITSAASSRDPLTLGKRIEASTSGIEFKIHVLTDHQTQAAHPWLVFDTSFLIEHSRIATGLFHQMLFNRPMITQRGAQEALGNLVGDLQNKWDDTPLQVVVDRFTESLSSAGATAGLLSHSPDHFAFVDRLYHRLSTSSRSFEAQILKLRQKLLCRERMVVGVTARREHWPLINQGVREIIDDAQSDSAARSGLKLVGNQGHRFYEGLIGSLPNTSVGKGVNLYHQGFNLHGSVYLVSHFLQSSHLFEEIRERGAAYRVRAPFDEQSGVFVVVSESDPSPAQTLRLFRNIPKYLSTISISDAELTRLKIGAIASRSINDGPLAQGKEAFLGILAGRDPGFAARIRREIAESTLDDIHQLGNYLSPLASRHSPEIVLGTRGVIKALNSDRAPTRRFRYNTKMERFKKS